MDTALAVDLWLETLTAEGRSPETLRNYRNYSRSLSALVPVLEATPEAQLALRRWLAEYGRTHAPDSLRTVFVAWRAFFNWCVREGMLAESPLRTMRQPKSPETTKEAYSRGELTALFAYLQGVRTPVGLRNHAMCAVLLDCGLRATELTRLTLDDVIEAGLLVRKSKGGRPRLVPSGERTRKALSRYLAHGRPGLRPKAPELFLNQFGRPMNRWGVQSMLDRMAKEVGFHLNAHKFRHTFATEHLRAGTPVETLRRLGGWADYSVLRLYTHLSIQDLAEAQLRASPLDSLRRDSR